jgi:uncharacterized protein YukE
MPHSLFDEVPESFFIPLASKSRRHYSQLLMVYYRLFETYNTGIEREQVVAAFEEYLNEEFETLGSLVENQLDDETIPQDDDPASDISPKESNAAIKDPQMIRALASDFLRRLITYGWMNEEILANYTQVINMSAWARPFYFAISETMKGLNVEYESHIIGIYSSLCSDAAAEQGHHAVLNALEHTRKLIESLKTLAQNIKTHIETMFHEDAEVRDLLHIHYDLYMHEIVDRAYNRLKTSDNLSKYRPVINRTIAEFMQNEKWMEKSALKLSIIRNCTKQEGRSTLLQMLKEIRDELRNIDPMLEEIDDKNRQYSRISTEKIKSHLYADASLHGKVKSIVQGLQHNEQAMDLAQIKLSNIAWLSPTSLYARKFMRVGDLLLAKPELADMDIEALETEMRLRIEQQLGPEKIRIFLDAHRHPDQTPIQAEEVINTMEDFIKILYATAYAEGREKSFPYRVVWGKKFIQKDRFQFKEHHFLPVSTKKKHAVGFIKEQFA